MQVVAVVGPSGAGKTTLLERLVPRLAERGRVGTVKSIHHDVVVDEPGKDTHRHRAAGAEATVGVSPGRTFGFLERGKQAAADADGHEAAALEPVLDAYADKGVAFALVEGFGGSALPKVAVGASGDGDRPAPVVARVDGGRDADLGPLLDAIDGLRGYETAASVLSRERGVTPSATVAVASVECRGLTTGADWTDGTGLATVEAIREDLQSRPAIERATADVRPPLAPGGTTAVVVSVCGSAPGHALEAVAEAGDRLAATTDVCGDIDYRVRRSRD